MSWAFLRSGGWERGVGGVGGFGGSGGSVGGESGSSSSISNNNEIPPGLRSSSISSYSGGGGSDSGILGSEELSLADKFRLVFSRGLFTP